MKLLTLIVSFLFVYSYSTHAQINTADNKLRIVEEYYPGAIVKNDGVREEGFILLTFGATQYSSVQFRKDINDLDTQRSYRPKDLLGYEIKHLKYTSFKIENDTMSIQNFARVLSEGCVNLLKFSEINEDGKEVNKFVVETKDNIHCLNQSGPEDSELLTKCMPDNPEIKSRIENLKPHYSTADIEGIVSAYNETCK